MSSLAAGALKYQMDQRGVEHWRHPFVDFNADSLRQGLPHAVAAMDKAIRNGHVVYCHCTAGMGRSPGVAIAYLYWCHQFETLDDAYDYLTSKRPCGPKKEAIRGATLDMLASHGDALPSHLVDAGQEGDSRGTTLTVEERWGIVRKLRLAMVGRGGLFFGKRAGRVKGKAGCVTACLDGLETHLWHERVAPALFESFKQSGLFGTRHCRHHSLH